MSLAEIAATLGDLDLAGMRRVGCALLVSLVPATTLAALVVSCGAEAAAPALPAAPPALPLAIEPGVLLAPARPFGDPIAVVDLMENAAAASAGAAWRFVDASIIEIDSNDPGPDLRPTGPAVRSHDVSPRPRAPGWDEAAWAPIAPSALSARRGHGHFALGWFRTRITLPAQVGATRVEGTTIVFEIVADDYSEVWVDGRLSASPGDAGGGPVSGFNTPNRVVLTRDAEPGHTYDLAVLAMNAPLSVSPPNFLWVRSAVLDVYAALPPSEPAGRIAERDPALGAILSEGARVERVATGFSRLAGMVWTDGALLFCDARANTIYRYDPVQQRVGVWRSHSGFMGADVGEHDEPGARSLAVDASERVLVVERGNRRLVRIERTAATTVLVDRFEDQRLDDPRAVAIDVRGRIWLADARGVLRVGERGATARALSDGARTAIVPSADGGALFVAQGARVVRHAVDDDALGVPVVVLDVDTTEGAIEALAIDLGGNLYVGRGTGVTIASPDGRVVGTIALNEPVLGLAVGGDDAPALFIAGRSTLYRVVLAASAL